MKPKVQKKTVTHFVTTDGREFNDEHAARAREAELNVIRFLAGTVTEEAAIAVIGAIRDDPDGFREVASPLWRRPRTKRATEPVVPEPPILAQGVDADVAPKKRRGRPPGSKNKPRVDGDGTRATV